MPQSTLVHYAIKQFQLWEKKGHSASRTAISLRITNCYALKALAIYAFSI